MLTCDDAQVAPAFAYAVLTAYNVGPVLPDTSAVVNVCDVYA